MDRKPRGKLNLRGRCREAGVIVHTPQEFLASKNVEVEARRFCDACRAGVDEARAQGVLMNTEAGRDVMDLLVGLYRWIMLERGEPRVRAPQASSVAAGRRESARAAHATRRPNDTIHRPHSLRVRAGLVMATSPSCIGPVSGWSGLLDASVRSWCAARGAASRPVRAAGDPLRPRRPAALAPRPARARSPARRMAHARDRRRVRPAREPTRLTRRPTPHRAR